MRGLIAGIDIGTSKIALSLIDPDKKVLINTLEEENLYLEFNEPWKREQDPHRIKGTVLNLFKRAVTPETKILSIGITGQMHGILGLDSKCRPVTNLVTWQDERGNLPRVDGKSLIQEMRDKINDEIGLASGFGIVTLYSWMKEGVKIDRIVTIEDYIGMELTGNRDAKIDYTMAESIGCFDIKEKKWRSDLLEKLGIDPRMLPEPVDSKYIVGNAKSKAFADAIVSGPPVSISIGDNQASFLGSVKKHTETILINIGTGSQISIAENNFKEAASYRFIDGKDVQIRPFIETSYLVAGNAISGGASYKILHAFFTEAGRRLFGLKDEMEISKDKIYKKMEEIATEDYLKIPADSGMLEVYPLFFGMRSNPRQRGWIKNIGPVNFRPSILIIETLKGMVKILTDMFDKETIDKKKYLVGSGNGIKRNRLLQKIITESMKKELKICSYNEEAVVGAAINGAVASGVFKDYKQAKEIVKYLD